MNTTSSFLATTPGRHAGGLPWLVAALAGGLVVGWLDRSATEVQGPLLVLMTIAFALSLPRRAPAWAIGIAAAIGLPLAHAVGHALGDGTGASWDMLIVTVPAGVAAYAGAGVGSLTRGASALVDRRFLIGAALVACTVVGFAPVYASLLARGQPFAWWVATIWQLVTLVGWAMAARFAIRRWQHGALAIDDGVHPTAITSDAGLVAGIAIGHSLLLPLLTRALFIPLGTAAFFDSVGWAFAVYLPLDALVWIALWAAALASDVDRRAAAATMREGAVRGELAVARLAGLRAQLRPHFLFNALNTASSLAARGDAEATRRVLTGLGDLLRYVMRGSEQTDSGDAGMVPLRDEIAFVQQYLAIERERFPERLVTTIDIADDVNDAVVPTLLLQPLVENAIVHGVGGRIGAGRVAIHAWREGSVLRITVRDDGPGPSMPNESSAGIGLANTNARLTVLYGGAATLTLDRAPDGGAVATVTVPFRTTR